MFSVDMLYHRLLNFFSIFAEDGRKYGGVYSIQLFENFNIQILQKILIIHKDKVGRGIPDGKKNRLNLVLREAYPMVLACLVR